MLFFPFISLEYNYNSDIERERGVGGGGRGKLGRKNSKLLSRAVNGMVEMMV